MYVLPRAGMIPVLDEVATASTPRSVPVASTSIAISMRAVLTMIMIKGKELLTNILRASLTSLSESNNAASVRHSVNTISISTTKHTLFHLIYLFHHRRVAT